MTIKEEIEGIKVTILLLELQRDDEVHEVTDEYRETLNKQIKIKQRHLKLLMMDKC